MHRTINTNEEPIILQEDRVILRNKRDGDRRVHLVLTNKSLIIEFVSGLLLKLQMMSSSFTCHMLQKAMSSN